MGEKTKKMETALARTTEEQAISRAIGLRFKDVSSVLPKHMTPERLCRIAVAAATRNPRLVEAAQQAPETVVAAVVEAASIGLEPLSILGHAYLVPRYNGSTRRMEVSLQIGYRGFIELAGRSGRIETIAAELVYPEDTFNVSQGTEQKIEHVPNFDRKPDSEPIAVYAAARFRDGGYQFRVLTRADIERIRDCSDSWRAFKAKKLSEDACPWAGPHRFEMWRKSAVRQLAKYLPLSPELVAAAAADEAREAGMEVNSTDMLLVRQGAMQADAEAAPMTVVDAEPEAEAEGSVEGDAREPGQEG